jgi:hypothetical protein
VTPHRPQSIGALVVDVAVPGTQALGEATQGPVDAVPHWQLPSQPIGSEPHRPSARWQPRLPWAPGVQAMLQELAICHELAWPMMMLRSPAQMLWVWGTH